MLPLLSRNKNARVCYRNTYFGESQDITLEALDTLNVNNSLISASTQRGKAGSLAINASESVDLKGFLWLENESLISASAFNAASGGNINIDTKFLIALPPEGSNGSDIIANAQQGAGGEIDIKAAGIFGLEERRAIPGNRNNDIDASSEFGSAGDLTSSPPLKGDDSKDHSLGFLFPRLGLH